MIAEGNQRQARDYLNRFLSSIPREDHLYHVTRTYVEPGYDSTAIHRINRETEVPLKMRALFYMAIHYKLRGQDSLAYTYFSAVNDANIYGLFETRIARHETKKRNP